MIFCSLFLYKLTMGKFNCRNDDLSKDLDGSGSELPLTNVVRRRSSRTLSSSSAGSTSSLLTIDENSEVTEFDLCPCFHIPPTLGGGGLESGDKSCLCHPNRYPEGRFAALVAIALFVSVVTVAALEGLCSNDPQYS